MTAFSVFNSFYLIQMPKSYCTLLMMVTHGAYAMLFQFYVRLSIIHNQDIYLIRPRVFHLLFSFPIFFFLLLFQSSLSALQEEIPFALLVCLISLLTSY